MIRIIINKRKGEKKYTFECMDVRNGSKMDIRYYNSRRQMIVDMVEAFEKWDETK